MSYLLPLRTRACLRAVPVVPGWGFSDRWAILVAPLLGARHICHSTQLNPLTQAPPTRRHRVLWCCHRCAGVQGCRSALGVTYHRRGACARRRGRFAARAPHTGRCFTRSGDVRTTYQGVPSIWDQRKGARRRSWWWRRPTGCSGPRRPSSACRPSPSCRASSPPSPSTSSTSWSTGSSTPSRPSSSPASSSRSPARGPPPRPHRDQRTKRLGY